MKRQSHAILLTALSSTLIACHSSEDSAKDATEVQAQALCGSGSGSDAGSGSGEGYTLFEAGQVRPLALSPNQQFLYATNTPDNMLEVYKVGNNSLTHLASIPVGLEPVAVSARTNNEVWVVNHLSDSVSIVSLDDNNVNGHVVRTLLVGDEPRDVVFAGPGLNRAFITTAHRGQNIPYDPQLTTAGVGRADVWAFDANALGSTLTGTPLSIITLFTDTPRALAVSPDGSTVYAAGFHTGNQTTVVSAATLPRGFGSDGSPGPVTDSAGDPAPNVGTILKWNGTHWLDPVGNIRDQYVELSLPDKDVFAINANANPPAQVAGGSGSGYWTGVGTVLFNMAVNPVSGKIYVSNTDANNIDRFEGPGIYAGHSLRGHLAESHISVLTPGGGVAVRHLNKHINYDVDGIVPLPTVPNAESVKSLAFPQSMVVTPDGATLYVNALGSSKVGIFSTAQLEADTFVPSTANQVVVSGGGPTGMVLNAQRNMLIVMTRFDDGISIINTNSRTETTHIQMHNPEPQSVTVGRRFLYDASYTSTHGDSACASCHIFGDFDSIAWNLGNPDGSLLNDPGPFTSALFNLITDQPMAPIFHPMKGVMTTQTLRGMITSGPMHWRGDRTAGNDVPAPAMRSLAFEQSSFTKFNVAFADLLGRSGPLSDTEMSEFTDFILQLELPPNPNQPLDGTETPDQAAGDAAFHGINCGIPACLDGTCGTLVCNSCHKLDPTNGFFGTTGNSSFAFNDQLFKIPHLRNIYQKVGMFGNPINSGFLPGDNGFKGDQVRGFGFTHDGAVDTVFRFHNGVGFSELTTGVGNGGFLEGSAGDVQRRQVEQFVLAFPTKFASIVGQETTLTASSQADVTTRISLLEQRADAGACDLVAKAEIYGVENGYLYLGSGMYATDTQGAPPISSASLQLVATQNQNPVTYTCVPPGDGVRIGVDRDADGYWDGTERAAGTDPANPASHPW